MNTYDCTVKFRDGHVKVEVEAEDYSTAAVKALRKAGLRGGRRVRANRETGVEPLSGIFQCYSAFGIGDATSFGPNIHVSRR